jgi:hypothetical protein
LLHQGEEEIAFVLAQGGRMAMGITGAALLLAAAALPAEPHPDFSGRWQLNLKESEDVHAKVIWSDGGRPASPSPNPGWPGGQRGGPGGRRRPGGPGGLGDGPVAVIEGDLPEGLRDFLEPPNTITIAANESGLTLSGDREKALHLVPDGQPMREGTVSRLTRWEGPSLVVDARADTGERLRTRYNMMPGVRKIEVFSMLSDRKHHTITLRRVYDAAEASPEPPAK